MRPPEQAEACYHCGLPVPAGSRFRAFIDGAQRAMCCAGCQAVAQTIAGADLGDYYRSRTALPRREDGQATDEAPALQLYDLPEVQADFVRQAGAAREVTLLLENITCAACIWLNEQHLSRLPGVLEVHINYTTHRALVRWDPGRVTLSQILEAVRAIGYRAFPSTSATAEEARRRERRKSLWRLFVAGFGMMQVMMYALPVYVASDGTMSADIEQLMRLASFVLTVPVIFYSAGPFFAGALRDLRLRRLGMDVPVALGIAVSMAASVWATFFGTGPVYYDSITMFVFFLLCGRFLEQGARQKAAASLEYLDRAVPLAAHRLNAYPGSLECEDVPAVALAAGDLVLVKPGEVVPADGVVVSGETDIDESLLTGESRAAARREGSLLVAASVNRSSPVVMRVDRVGEATRASHIRRLTERAASQRPRVVEITDRIAAWFVAAVLVVAAGAALIWLRIDPSRALWIAVAVLVVTCPCALSLATPTALAVSIGALARRGVVATRVHAIETLGRITHVVFDKTGTLTEGRLTLTAIEAAPGIDRDEVLALAAGLEAASEHPLARAILSAADAARLTPPAFEQVVARAGAGVEARLDGRRYRLGRRDYVAELCGALPRVETDGDTPVWLGSGQGWLGQLRFADALRGEAAKVVRTLRAAGKEVLILSGDDAASVARVARQLEVTRFEGGLHPEDKHARVQALQRSGAIVAMVGDGVNDAPVLAQAQLSIAMGSGAILSQAQADLVLLSGRLGGLLDALALSHRTMAVVKENLWWAALYNVVALPLAVAGHVTPWLAGIGMAASSLLVVLNALRLIDRVPADSARTPTARNGDVMNAAIAGEEDPASGRQSPIPGTQPRGPSPQPRWTSSTCSSR